MYFISLLNVLKLLILLAGMRITKATYRSWRMNRWWRYSCMQNRAPCSWQMHMEHKRHLSFCPGAGADAEVSHKGCWRSCEQALPSAPSGTASERNKLDGSTLCPLMCSLGNPGTGLLLCPVKKMSLKLPEWPQTPRVTHWAAKSQSRSIPWWQQGFLPSPRHEQLSAKYIDLYLV